MSYNILDHPLFVVLLVFTVLTVVLEVILQYRVSVLVDRIRKERSQDPFSSAISSIRYVLAADWTLLIAIAVGGLGLFISWELFSAGQQLLGVAFSALAFIASLAKTLTLGSTRDAGAKVGSGQSLNRKQARGR